ncbi:hypothetical protein [Streptomyces sp. CAU 1734]|uniref:hypothetical protein n=1 Tax=Streptomyces sp. CAU 1734 TaxID=3140360 RepID=UPI0032613831
MADSQDEMMEYLAHRLNFIYTGLVATCDDLPLPIALPRSHDGVSSIDALAALRRAADIADEVPMPESPRAALYTAIMMFLSASDLFALLIGVEYESHRADAALALLTFSEMYILELAAWLASDND